MGERAVADIVKQYRYLSRFPLGFTDRHALFCNVPKLCPSGAWPQSMLEARVKSTGINQIGEAELFNVPEPLKKRVLDQIRNQRTAQGDESV